MLQVVQNGLSMLSSYESHARVLVSVESLVLHWSHQGWQIDHESWRFSTLWRHEDTDLTRRVFAFKLLFERHHRICQVSKPKHQKSATKVYMYMYHIRIYIYIYIYGRLIDSFTLIHLSSLPRDDSHRSTVHFSATMSAAWKNLVIWSWSSITIHHNTANIDKSRNSFTLALLLPESCRTYLQVTKLGSSWFRLEAWLPVRPTSTETSIQEKCFWKNELECLDLSCLVLCPATCRW